MSQPSQPIFEENNHAIRRVLLDQGLSPEVELQRPKHQLFSVVTNCLVSQQRRNLANLKDMFTKLASQQEESTTHLSTKFTDNLVVTTKHEDK